MQLRVVHRTGYTYDGVVAASYNEARMTPLTAPGQIVVHARVDIAPTPWTFDYRDYFGSRVTAFEVLDAHAELRVTAVATVHTHRAPLPRPTLPWAALRRGHLLDELCEYLDLPALVAPPDDLAARAEEIARAATYPAEAARAICAMVHDDVEYRQGATHVLSPASHAWSERAGVCQDIAHLVVGALRSVGIPARYVSGYLHPSKQPAPGETVAGESHAWVEYWDDGWCGYDPTNDQPIGDRHVLVATGRDYRDVRPLSGIYTGPGPSAMFVDVQVTRLA